MESGFATRPQVQKVVFQHQHKWGKWFCITGTSVESGFATLTQVWKWFSTLTQVRKVVLKHEQKCEKWFCIASTSVESGFATQQQVGKVVFNTNRSTKSGFQH